MPAYLIVEHSITDAERFKEYGTKVMPMIAAHGGRLLTRSGTHRVLETGHFLPDRVAIFEFPDMAALELWYGSDDYRPLIELRQSAVDLSVDMMIVVDGA